MATYALPVWRSIAWNVTAMITVACNRMANATKVRTFHVGDAHERRRQGMRRADRTHMHRLTYPRWHCLAGARLDYETCGIEHLKDDVIGIADATERASPPLDCDEFDA